MNRTLRVCGIIAAFALAALLAACSSNQSKPGANLDEALAAGRNADSFTAAADDYLHDMDGGIPLSHAQIAGRNTWIIWTGGNDRFWDRLSTLAIGSIDLLETISSYPCEKRPWLKACFGRFNRWNYLGLINEPCFKAPAGPDPNRFGLWLDVRVHSKDCPPDPFENERKYPGVKTGARGTTFADGKTLPVGSFYGYATGVVGLRLFPNPAFDAKAEKAWNAERYYADPKYFANKNLIKPYRVGMSCGFCHIGPSPIHPPADPNNPRWADLSSTVGAQYMWADRIFSWKQRDTDFITQLFRTWQPGTLDTSLVSSDNINNPRTMNAVYAIMPRLDDAHRFGREKLVGGEQDNRQFNDYVQSGTFTTFYQAPDTVLTPHVLKDGADSVGVLGALNRVYINIGTDSEEWLLHFNPIVGGKTITPIPIKVARANSAAFAATENQTFNEALFLIEASKQLDHLSDAPGGAKYLSKDQAMLTRGKIVFANTCARCHSSKLPQGPDVLTPDGCVGPEYLNCFKRYWALTKTPAFQSQMRKIVLAPDFLQNNYLSADIRVPVTLLHTNACSPLATNAIANNIWDNFSSSSYKSLPSAGTITWYDPYTGTPYRYQLPAGGRGYTRVPSLIALWSTAPYLLNNRVGPFDPSPSVDTRMRVFQASIEQMLWPEKREHDALLGTAVPGKIDRTDSTSSVTIDAKYLPDLIGQRVVTLRRLLPQVFAQCPKKSNDPDAGICIGPIPKGTPVGLLTNVRLLAEDLQGSQRGDYARNRAQLVPKILLDLLRLPPNATDDQARAVFKNLYPGLLKISKCPDLVVNRGHYFGTGYTEPNNPFDPDLDPGPGLSDQDKRALIEFLKTF